MSRTTYLILVATSVALAILGVAGVAHAQQPLSDDGLHPIRLGLAGGVVVPTSGTREALREGIHAQGFLLVNVLPGVPLRFNLGYEKFNLKQAMDAATSPESADAGNTRLLSGVAAAQLNLLRGPVRPYVTLGLGGFDVTNTLAAAAGGATSVSQMRFGIDGGAGLALKIGRLDAFIEGHLQNVYTERGLVDAKSIQAVPVSFGVLF